MKMIYKTFLATFCCTMALNAYAQERTFHRNKVLIEKHTGTGCKACPAADIVIDNYIADTNSENDVAVLRHHSFRGGKLNTSCSETISATWFIGAWPSMLVDRYGFFDEKTECKGHSTVDAYKIRNLQTIESRMDTPTYVSLSLAGSSFDPATKKLRLVISGEVTKNLPFLRIHAFITQSGIKYYQEGETGNYIHNDAVRDCLTNNADGDVLVQNSDGTYSMMFEKTILDQYGDFKSIMENMKVVAFVSSFVDESVKYEARDYSTCEVHNADAIEILDLPKQSPCAAPTIEYVNGAFICTSTTSGAICHYDIAPCTLPSDGQGTIVLTVPAFTVTAYADADGYARSAKVRRTFTVRDILGEDTSDVNDVNGDGRITVDDVEALARKILRK